MALRVFVAAELSFNCWGEMPISLEFADTGSDQKEGKLETVGKGGCLCAVCTALSYQKKLHISLHISIMQFQCQLPCRTKDHLVNLPWKGSQVGSTNPTTATSSKPCTWPPLPSNLSTFYIFVSTETLRCFNHIMVVGICWSLPTFSTFAAPVQML